MRRIEATPRLDRPTEWPHGGPGAGLTATASAACSENRSRAVAPRESPASQAGPDRTASPDHITDQLSRPGHAVLPIGRSTNTTVGPNLPGSVRDAVVVRPVPDPSAVFASFDAFPGVEGRMRVVMVLVNQRHKWGSVDQRHAGGDRVPHTRVVGRRSTYGERRHVVVLPSREDEPVDGAW